MRVVASEGVQLLYSVSITYLPFDLCPRVRPVRLPQTLCGGATAKAVFFRSCLAQLQGHGINTGLGFHSDQGPPMLRYTAMYALVTL